MADFSNEGSSRQDCRGPFLSWVTKFELAFQPATAYMADMFARLLFLCACSFFGTAAILPGLGFAEERPPISCEKLLSGIELQTARTVLRQTVEADVPFLEQMLSDPLSSEMQNMAFDAEIARDFATSLAWMNEDPVQALSLSFTVFAKTTGKPIGLVYLCPFVPGERATLAYSILRAHWGKGFVTETARAVLEFARKHLGITSFRAGVTESNRASRRVLEKLGFAFTGPYPNVAIDTLVRQAEPILLYELKQ